MSRRGAAALLLPLLALHGYSPAAHAAGAASQTPSPSPSPTERFPSPNCVDYGASLSEDEIVAGSPAILQAHINGNGNYDHDVAVTPAGYTRRPELRPLPAETFVRQAGGGLPAPDGSTHPRWSFSPTTNSRVWVRYEDRCKDGQQRSGETERLLVKVAPRLTLSATRNGSRHYTFSGQALSRPGQVINLYRVGADGREVLTSRTTSTTRGTWSVDRMFTGSGRFEFIVRTTSDVANSAGLSNRRPTVIH